MEIPGVPAPCNVLYDDFEQAIGAPLGDIYLGYCPVCSHLYNLAYDPELIKYSIEYENSLHFSPKFQAYAQNLAKSLIEKYDLYHKHVVEIGCGKGDFLRLLCRLGKNKGIGFDPSFDPDRTNDAPSEEIEFVQDFYSRKYADLPADFVCCRHVLEHFAEPKDLLTGLRQTLKSRPDSVIFFEVPNSLFTLRDLGIWDLIYEHPSYFSAGSLRRLFQESGFDILDIHEEFQSQYLCLEAKQTAETKKVRIKEKGEDIDQYVDKFVARYQEKINFWRNELERACDKGAHVVIWGGGSKGITFLNVFKAIPVIKYLVDINPHKQGKYVPGSGQQIVGPEFLKTHKPDIIILANSVYRHEIERSVQGMGLTPAFKEL